MSGAKVEVTVDPELCVGSMTCLDIAPDAFDMDDDGHAFPTRRITQLDEDIDTAVGSCPARAISVRDAD